MSWQKELQKNARKTQDLLELLPMIPKEQQQMTEILERYPMSVTPYYLSLINFDDPGDPIRKMAIPSIEETDMSGSFDTSGEAQNTVVEGLQHKYAETAMMLSTNLCAMYCRHCFRKRMVGLSDEEIATQFDGMVNYIKSHTEITNVLISGGDALMNTNRWLDHMLSILVKVDHLDNIRIASRMPVVMPSRISEDEELLSLLDKYNRQKQLFVVTQYNHPTELSEQSVAAVKAIQKTGVPVKNQTVLMKGVNDDPAVLSALLRGMVSHGIDPYYIFQCRPVTGVKNQFQLPLKKGIEVVEKAKATQNGLGKCFKYAMSHVSGKLEIVGMLNDDEMLFKYHEAADPANLGKLFTRKLSDGQTWLDDDAALS